MPPIFTIGHSTHELDAFLGLLRGAEIELLVDVRRYPSSRRFPWFNGPALAEAVPAYRHEEALGGRRQPAPDSRNGGWRVGQFRGYADHMASPEFQAAVDRLLEEPRRTAVMCAEAQWWRCHRRLLSDALVARGAEVCHIASDGRAQRHELTPVAVVEGERLVYPPEQTALDV